MGKEGERMGNKDKMKAVVRCLMGGKDLLNHHSAFIYRIGSWMFIQPLYLATLCGSLEHLMFSELEQLVYLELEQLVYLAHLRPLCSEDWPCFNPACVINLQLHCFPHMGKHF